jgi:hypothetical protein
MQLRGNQFSAETAGSGPRPGPTGIQRANQQPVRISTVLVNTSGKAGAQIPHPPWEMIHPPGGDNAVCR